MKIEIWSDVVCPWCYIGKRRFESALALFAHRDAVDVEWRSFQLDPSAPTESHETMADLLSHKYNMRHDQALGAIAKVTAAAAKEGLEYRLDEARHGNTRDAHRLLHLAKSVGLQAELKERLMSGYFTEGRRIGDHDALLAMATEVGLSADDVQRVLDGTDYEAAVLLEQKTAAELGVRGVPFFVIDRAFGISGAQSSDVILDVLQEAWDAREQDLNR